MKPQESPSAYTGICSVGCLPSSQDPRQASSWGGGSPHSRLASVVQGPESSLRQPGSKHAHQGSVPKYVEAWGSMGPGRCPRTASGNLWMTAGGSESISNLNEIWFSCLTKQFS